MTAGDSACAASPRFLGLSTDGLHPAGFWEGPTDYDFALRPRGAIRAIMLFARFSDTSVDEATTDLYQRLAPPAVSFFARVSYGKMSLRVDAHHEWFPMELPSTAPEYKTDEFHTQRAHLQEAILKASAKVDFAPYDIVYLVDSRSPGMPNSPTFGAPKGEGIDVQGKEIRHGVTFGNDFRGDRWGWQTLCHETGHIFGLPDLYSFDYKQAYKGIQKYVGFWDMMGFQAVGSEYLAWQKRKLEWLTDSDFAVVPVGATAPVDIDLAPIYEKSGIRGVVVPISATEAYAAEVRSRNGPDDPATGVLLYRVALTAGHEGHIRVIPAAPDDNLLDNEHRYITLYNALYRDGRVLDDPATHARIEIAGRAGSGFRLRVSR